MKKFLTSLVTAAVLCLPVTFGPAVQEASAQSVYVGPGGVGVDTHGRYRSERRYRYRDGGSDGRTCARLRRACEFKGERGQRGEGNCRRYRAICG
jgi:hypothetical protein